MSVSTLLTYNTNKYILTKDYRRSKTFTKLLTVEILGFFSFMVHM